LKILIQLYEGNRLKKERVTLIYENSRLRRESESIRKELSAANELKNAVLNREYKLKKRLIELKNELVKIRVKEDMGEYNQLIVGSDESPGPKSLRKILD
jgi:regulator of replication initiation timing